MNTVAVMQSPIRSRAQHDMFTRALADPEYAQKRGISVELAQRMLDGHAAAGSSELPSRITEAIRDELPPGVVAIMKQRRRYKLLGSDD